MARERRLLRAEHDGAAAGGTGADAARWVLRAPLIGRIVALPLRGSHLEPGAVVGAMTVFHREIDLVMPEEARGLVIERLVAGRHPWVAWGAPLLRVAESLELAAPGDERATLARGARETGGNPGEADLPAGRIAVRAPTDGLFYRRPNPDSPPYVSEGAAIEAGAVLGLIEVMKCFNPIVYGKDGIGAAGAQPGTIEEILATDGGEVRSGQILIVVRPRD